MYSAPLYVFPRLRMNYIQMHSDEKDAARLVRRSVNAATHLLDRHSDNAAAQLANAQSECKEVPTVRQNARRHLSHLNARKY